MRRTPLERLYASFDKVVDDKRKIVIVNDVPTNIKAGEEVFLFGVVNRGIDAFSRASEFYTTGPATGIVDLYPLVTIIETVEQNFICVRTGNYSVESDRAREILGVKNYDGEVTLNMKYFFYDIINVSGDQKRVEIVDYKGVSNHVFDFKQFFDFEPVCLAINKFEDKHKDKINIEINILVDNTYVSPF